MNMRNSEKWIGQKVPKSMIISNEIHGDYFVSVWSGKLYHQDSYVTPSTRADELYIAYKELGIEDASEISTGDLEEIDRLIEKKYPNIFERNDIWQAW